MANVSDTELELAFRLEGAALVALGGSGAVSGILKIFDDRRGALVVDFPLHGDPLKLLSAFGSQVASLVGSLSPSTRAALVRIDSAGVPRVLSRIVT